MFKMGTAVATAVCDLIVDRCDAGAAAATLKVYAGAVAAAPNDAPAGALLATVTLADPAFGAATSIDSTVSRATMTDPAATTWSASGTAGCYLVEDSDGNNVWQDDCGVTGSGESLELSSVTAVSGSPFDITSFVFNVPTGDDAP